MRQEMVVRHTGKATSVRSCALGGYAPTSGAWKKPRPTGRPDEENTAPMSSPQTRVIMIADQYATRHPQTQAPHEKVGQNLCSATVDRARPVRIDFVSNEAAQVGTASTAGVLQIDRDSGKRRIARSCMHLVASYCRACSLCRPGLQRAGQRNRTHQFGSSDVAGDRPQSLCWQWPDLGRSRTG